MKRLIVRIAALCAVVVLGLFAIAQAQRGVGDKSPADGADFYDTSADTESSGNPMRRSNGSATQPAGHSEVSTNSGNPLRTTSGEIASRQEPGVNRWPPDNSGTNVVYASATSPVEAAPRVSPSGSSGGGAGPVGIPMARPAAGSEMGSPLRGGAFPDASAVGLGAPLSNTSPMGADPSAMAPPTATAGRYPALAGTSSDMATSAAPPTATRAAEPFPAPSSATRYPAPPVTLPLQNSNSSGEDEPNRFRPDPFALPTSTPSAYTATDSSPARPGSSLPDYAVAGSTMAASTMGGSTMGGSATAMGDAAALSPSEGTGQPGSKQLEGPQCPRLSVEKFAPAEIQVGKPSTFRVTVGNTGETAASGVEIHDQIPKGTRLMTTTPRASRGARGELVWNVGTIQPGDETTVEMQLMPVAEGEIGSVATVNFSATASARTTSTRPQLVIKTSAPAEVLIGEEVLLSITISNPGSGIATGVVLSEQIPAGLRHASGNDLEYEVGDLKPGESKKLELSLTAARAGQVINVLSAQGDGNLRAEDRATLEVLAPKLDIAVTGSKRRYLEREATYQLSLANPGTAAAKDIELVAYLPSGLKFISANNAGYYKEADHSIHWKLQELANGETGTVELVTMPVEPGQHKMRLRGTAKRGLQVEKEQPVSVEGIAAIMFEAVDVQDPIEVGGETTFEIRVLNQGSKAASNVRVVVMLPPQMQAVAAEGPTRHVVDGNRILFDGLSRLAPKADVTYRVRVKGLQPGDLRTSVKVMTDEMQTPVTKEESTRVYSDE